MSQTTPERNMAIIANGAELTRLVMSKLVTNEKTRHLLKSTALRETVYRVFNSSVARQLDPSIRALPTGQFNRSILTGKHQSGNQNPNVTA